MEVVPGVGVPFTIAQRAVEWVRSQKFGRNRKDRRNSFEKADQVWAVFDRDSNPRYNDAIALCKQYGVRVGRSNPCFELWLILHEKDHDRYENRTTMQTLLKKLRPEYDKDRRKIPNCDELVTRVEQAEQRAVELLLRRQQTGNPFGNPSTTVGLLTRSVRMANTLAQPRGDSGK